MESNVFGSKRFSAEKTHFRRSHTLACHLVVTGRISVASSSCASDAAKVLYVAHCLRDIIPIWKIALAIDSVSYRTCMLLFPQLQYEERRSEDEYEPYVRSGMASPYRDFQEASSDQRGENAQDLLEKVAKRNFVNLVFKDILNRTSVEEKKYLAQWRRRDVRQIGAFGLLCLVGSRDIPDIF